MLPFKKSLLNSICDFQTFVKLSPLQRLKSQISQEIRKWLKCLSHSHHNSFFHQASDLDMWHACKWIRTELSMIFIQPKPLGQACPTCKCFPLPCKHILNILSKRTDQLQVESEPWAELMYLINEDKYRHYMCICHWRSTLKLLGHKHCGSITATGKVGLEPVAHWFQTFISYERKKS